MMFGALCFFSPLFEDMFGIYFSAVHVCVGLPRQIRFVALPPPPEQPAMDQDETQQMSPQTVEKGVEHQTREALLLEKYGLSPDLNGSSIPVTLRHFLFCLLILLG